MIGYSLESMVLMIPIKLSEIKNVKAGELKENVTMILDSKTVDNLPLLD